MKNTVSGSRAAAVSKTIHVATKGGKVGNTKKLDIKYKKKGKWKKAGKVSVAIGKTTKLKVKQKPVKKKLKVKKHCPPRYETSNPRIAVVSTKGIIAGKAKGSCIVYVYAQNGVCKELKVTVK
jgi:hypothetical protein